MHIFTSSLSKFKVFSQATSTQMATNKLSCSNKCWSLSNMPFFPNLVLCRPIKNLFEGTNTFNVESMVHLKWIHWRFFFYAFPFLTNPRLKLLKNVKNQVTNSCHCEAINPFMAISTFIITVVIIIITVFVIESHHHHSQHHHHAELSFTLDVRYKYSKTLVL